MRAGRGWGTSAEGGHLQLSPVDVAEGAWIARDDRTWSGQARQEGQARRQDRRIQELEKKLRAAEKELQIRQALIELQKKVSALLSIVPNSEES